MATSYDRFGNRWQQNYTQGPGAPSSVSFTFDGDNRISTEGYVYDAAGNLVMDNLNCYTYDAENRLVSVAPETTPGSDVCGATTMSYLYDPDGRRVARVQGGAVVKQYYYDAAGHMITEANASGATLRAEIYAGERHLATWANNATYFNHADWLGTERARSNSSGTRCEKITSLPFGDGMVTQQDNGGCSDPSPSHFTGKERDSESGLDYFGARYNASSLGRFMTPDPTMKSVNGLNPQTWNRYSYVVNNPLRFIDPLGLWAISYQDEFDKRRRLKYRIIVVSKSKEGDSAATLAKQLGFKGKDADNLAAQITKKSGDAGSIQLSKMGGIVGRTFGVAESGLTEQAKYAAKGGDPTKGPSSLLYNDCSMTCARIASPSNVPMGGEWGIQSTNNLIQQLGLPPVNSGDERTGDIIRWGTDAKTHFANVLFTGDDGITQVFSRSGVNGRFEVVPEQNPSFQSGYGPITGEFRPTE